MKRTYAAINMMSDIQSSNQPNYSVYIPLHRKNHSSIMLLKLRVKRNLLFPFKELFSLVTNDYFASNLTGKENKKIKTKYVYH